MRVTQLSICSLALLLPLGVPPMLAPAMIHMKSFPLTFLYVLQAAHNKT